MCSGRTNNSKLPKSFEFFETEQPFRFVCSVLACFGLENLFKNVEIAISSKNIKKHQNAAKKISKIVK